MTPRRSGLRCREIASLDAVWLSHRAGVYRASRFERTRYSVRCAVSIARHRLRYLDTRTQRQVLFIKAAGIEAE
jgi:hypothetical protein